MTKVEMTVSISGTRNGERWPEKGEQVDVSSAEAEILIEQGYAKRPGKGGEKATAEPAGEKRTTRKSASKKKSDS